MSRITLPGVMAGAGFLLAILSCFPLAAFPWLSHDATFLGGIVLFVGGLGLVEAKSWRADQ